MLSSAGIASRRQIERLIREGRVVVDGKPAKIGDHLAGGERVLVDGRPVKPVQALRHAHLIYYKPVGEITSRDDREGRKLVFDSLPKPKRGRWISVGRLDIATSGLLLFTTDGELAHRLMHPRYEIARTYAVRLLGELEQPQIEQLLSGVELEDGPARFERVIRSGGQGANVWYHVTLREGRNREVRRVFEAFHIAVSRLIRIAYGPIELGRLSRGKTRYLTKSETDALYAAVGLEPNAG